MAHEQRAVLRGKLRDAAQSATSLCEQPIERSRPQ